MEPTLTTAAGSLPEPETYSISELAAAFGITPRSIRFYEDAGLLAPRRVGMARVYSRSDRARLALICRGKRLGFSLAEIGEFLDLYDVDADQVEQMRYALGRVQARVGALETQRRDLDQTVDELRALEGQIVDHLRRHDASPKGS